MSSLQLLLLIASLAPFVACQSFPQDEVSALNAFKEAIYEDPLLVLSNWNVVDANPCEWSGVYCSSAGDHVVKINISESSLRGFISPDLSRITNLQELILHRNNLLGTIPKELGMLKQLKRLDLGANQLTGPIPAKLANISGILKINLQSNGLTGNLPSGFGDLKYLQELVLDRNRLQGTFPASNGSPSTARGMYRESFQGNCLQNKDTKQRAATQCSKYSAPQPMKNHQTTNPRHPAAEVVYKDHRGKSKPTWLLVLEIVTGIMVGAIFVVFVFTAFQRWNTRAAIIMPWKKSSSQKEPVTVYIADTDMLKDVAKFNRQELEVACEDFSNIIGSSPDSLVYKGIIKGGPEIAVISLCIKEELWTGYLELYFQREVADLARLNHENTGKFLGYCKESSPFTRMLVFDYASNGTLNEHLHYGEENQLSWTRRMRIITGIARGLKYLHEELNPPFTISELNSSAVYLTEDFSPKLVDFESWKSIVSRSEKNSGSIGGQGAICVLPNSMEARHLDIKGNVYAFGILLLEIISGRPPYCKDKGPLVEWAKDLLESEEAMCNLVDPELKNFRLEDLKAVCEAVTLSIHPDATKRPSMKELCTMLESRIDTTVSYDFKASSLAWAELALSTQ
ncbi:Probable LRR receptor-like serine/threonine-protein kinase At1g63430 [Linum perenne]